MKWVLHWVCLFVGQNVWIIVYVAFLTKIIHYTISHIHSLHSLSHVIVLISFIWGIENINYFHKIFGNFEPSLRWVWLGFYTHCRAPGFLLHSSTLGRNDQERKKVIQIIEFNATYFWGRVLCSIQRGFCCCDRIIFLENNSSSPPSIEFKCARSPLKLFE